MHGDVVLAPPGPSTRARHRRDPTPPVLLATGTEVTAQFDGVTRRGGVWPGEPPDSRRGVLPVRFDDGAEWAMTARDLAVVMQLQGVR